MFRKKNTMIIKIIHSILIAYFFVAAIPDNIIKNNRYLPPEKSLVAPLISVTVRAIKRNLLNDFKYSILAKEKIVV